MGTFTGLILGNEPALHPTVLLILTIPTITLLGKCNIFEAPNLGNVCEII